MPRRTTRFAVPVPAAVTVHFERALPAPSPAAAAAGAAAALYAASKQYALAASLYDALADASVKITVPFWRNTDTQVVHLHQLCACEDGCTSLSTVVGVTALVQLEPELCQDKRCQDMLSVVFAMRGQVEDLRYATTRAR